MITYILPYYRAPRMLQEHLNTWASYTVEIRECMRLLIVDDGSPEPAEPIVRAHMRRYPTLPIQLYRIVDDIPWNRNGARNLGSHVAKTPWLLHTDIDHLLPFSEADKLMHENLDSRYWFRFKRFRRGRADDTRKKDALPVTQEFGEVKPHGDSFLCSKQLYWRVGGYDEDYSSHLGGGTPFLEQMSEAASCVLLSVALHVYTRSTVADASVSTLSRSPEAYMKMRAEKRRTGNIKARNPLRFKWERVI